MDICMFMVDFFFFHDYLKDSDPTQQGNKTVGQVYYFVIGKAGELLSFPAQSSDIFMAFIHET